MTKSRAAYYLVLIALLMPALPDGSPANQKPSLAKSAAVTDTTGEAFCASHDTLCGATSYLLQKFEAKAKFPIHVLNNWAGRASSRQAEQRA